MDDDSFGATEEKTLQTYFHFREYMSDFPETECIADIWVLGSICLEEKDSDLSLQMKMGADILVHICGGVGRGWFQPSILNDFSQFA